MENDEWERRSDINKHITCRDCGDLVQLYMVKDELWEQAVPDDPHDMSIWICMPCLADRLGRPITVFDLNDAPCNEDWTTLT